MSFLHIDMTQVIEPLPQVTEELNLLYIAHICQYHGCWCTGEAWSQGISYHDIDYIEMN